MIFLINPPFNISKENYDSSISVGLLSIASYLDSKEIPVEIIDGVRQKNYLELIKDRVKPKVRLGFKTQPNSKLKTQLNSCNYVGISVMTTQVANALKISKLVREINPKCKIIWGGIHASFFTKQTVEHDLVDIVGFGEGEKTVYEIVTGKDLKEINGIAYKKDGKLVVNPLRELHDPKLMPLFNWELESDEILNNLDLIPSLTSRGCPHRCTFCVNAILKNKWRPRTAEQVLQDLEIIKNKNYFKNKKLRFWDENFFVDITRAKKIINGMLEKNLNMPWETTVRANYIRDDMIDNELMSKLKKSGCYLLSFGAESGCPRILKKIKKDITPEQILHSAKIALKYDIIPQYSFMIGLPGESKSDMMETLKLIDKLVKLSPKIQILGPQAFRPYPGSELYQECIASGWQAPNSLNDWAKAVEDELNYLDIKRFPWVKHKDFVESMEAYVRFGAHSIKSAMGSTIKSNKLLKLGFVLLCKLRWKLKFFWFPFEFKLAKKFVIK